MGVSAWSKRIFAATGRVKACAYGPVRIVSRVSFDARVGGKLGLRFHVRRDSGMTVASLLESSIDNSDLVNPIVETPVAEAQQVPGGAVGM